MITITDKAASEILSQSKDKGYAPQLRIGIRAGGCTGFSQFIEWAASDPEPTDSVFENGQVKVFVDAKSLVYLEGTEVDFVSSLMQRGFKLNSPKVKGSCGCGESVEF